MSIFQKRFIVTVNLTLVAESEAQAFEVVRRAIAGIIGAMGLISDIVSVQRAPRARGE